MADPIWPLSLDQTQLLGTLAGFQDVLLRTAMSAGPAKQRRRQTANTSPQRVPMWMTDAQRATFKTFFETTLQGGALVFDYTDVTTGATAKFRFTQTPDPPVSYAPGLWRIILPLEVMP